MRAARSVVFALAVQGADRAEKSGEDRLVELGIARRRLIRTQIELAHAAAELPVKVLPLAHPRERQEVLATPFAQLVAGKRGGLLAVRAPEIEHGEEVRA